MSETSRPGSYWDGTDGTSQTIADLRYELKLAREHTGLVAGELADARSQLTAHQAGNAKLLDEQKRDAATIAELRVEAAIDRRLATVDRRLTDLETRLNALKEIAE